MGAWGGSVAAAGYAPFAAQAAAGGVDAKYPGMGARVTTGTQDGGRTLLWSTVPLWA